MNIEDLNKKIYGYKDLGEGEYVNNILETIESQQLTNLGFNKFNDENKQIKF